MDKMQTNTSFNTQTQNVHQISNKSFHKFVMVKIYITRLLNA